MATWQRMAVAVLAVSAANWCAAQVEVQQAAVEPAAAKPPEGEAKDTATEMKPSRITLELKDAAPEEAFDQIGRQAGMELVVDDGGMWQLAQPVTISVKDAPFWPTLLKLCQQANVGFNQYYDQSRPRTIRLSRGDNYPVAKRPWCQSDSFVVVAQAASRNYSISYDNPASAQGNFTLQLMVLCDPAMRVQQIGNVTVNEAVDEKGVSLKTGTGNMSYGSQPGFMQQAGLMLNYPPNAGKKIARIKGSLRPVVVVKTEDISIDAPLGLKTPVKKQLADYDVAIGPLKKPSNQGGSYELTVVFSPKSGAGVRRERSTDYWSLVNAIELSDAEGRRLSYSGGGGGGGDRSITYNVHFSSQGGQVGEPQKLVWRLPAETREVAVPFELTDLVIP